MTQRDPSDLQIERLLDAEREFPEVSPQVRSALRESVHSRLARVVAKSTISSALSSASTPGAASVVTGAGKIVLSAMLMAGVGSAIWAVGSNDTPAATTRLPETPRISPRNAPAHPSHKSPADTAPPPLAQSSEARPISSTIDRRPHRSRTAADKTTIRVMPDAGPERVLIDQARAALQRGRYQRVLADVHRHERMHPDGEFVEEREVLAVRALAGLGRSADASIRAHAFTRSYPASIHMPLVRAVAMPETAIEDIRDVER